MLNGEGRLEAIAADADMPTIDDGELTVEATYARALVLNDARGHEDKEVIRQRRKAKVAKMRSRGVPVRKIAQAVGAGVGTVHRDMEEANLLHTKTDTSEQRSGVPFGTPDPREGDEDVSNGDGADGPYLSGELTR